MNFAKTRAEKYRHVLAVVAVLCIGVGIWLLFYHPGLEVDALGVGLMGTPLFLHEARRGVWADLQGWGTPVIFLGYFLLTQWAFLWQRGGWGIKLSDKGRPMTIAVLIAACMAMLLTTGIVATFLEIPDWWIGTAVKHDQPIYVWCVLICLWALWTGIFYVYWRAGDRFTQMSRMTHALIAGSCLELLVAIPVHAWVYRRDNCYCQRGSYTGLVFGITVLVWAFGPGVILLFLRERYRREKLLLRLCPRCGSDLPDAGTQGGKTCAMCGERIPD